MKDKEIEEKLQDGAGNIKMSEFDKLWQQLKPRIEQEIQKKIRRRKIWRTLATSVACVLITCSVALSIALSKPTSPSKDTVLYLNSDLTAVPQDKTSFLMAINNSGLEVVDLSRFELDVCSVFQTEDKKVKGGKSEFLDSKENPTCIVLLKFYSNDVEVSDDYYNVLDMYHTTQSGATIGYRHESSFNKYYVKAEYKSMQYYMEYVGIGDTITQFFEMFFE